MNSLDLKSNQKHTYQEANNTCIIGNGLIAKSFCGKKFTKKTIVFASGVSNSTETRHSEYSRERELLINTIKYNDESTIIYFSTTSLGSKTKTAYTQHKSDMEQIVKKLAKSFYIFRLPQVVGFVKNQTLISFFINAIINKETLTIQINAKRNLIDVDDISRIACHIVNNRLEVNSTVNISSSMCIPVKSIIDELSSLLKIEAKYTFIDSGNDQCTDIQSLDRILDKHDPIFKDGYWQSVLKKYIHLYVN